MHALIPCTQCYCTSCVLVVTEVVRPLLYQFSFQHARMSGAQTLGTGGALNCAGVEGRLRVEEAYVRFTPM
jgi:hypothetical protein